MLRISELVVKWLARRAAARAERDEQAWREFERIRTIIEARDMRLGEIIAVQQHTQAGTKAWVRWIGSGDSDAVWVENVSLHSGQILPLSGSYDYGSHHSENVYCVDKIGSGVSRATYKGWKRYRVKGSAYDVQARGDEGGTDRNGDRATSGIDASSSPSCPEAPLLSQDVD